MANELILSTQSFETSVSQLSDDELRTLRKTVDELLEFINYSRSVLNLRVKGIKTAYVLDADVLFPIIKPNAVASRHALAINYVLSQLAGPFVLPNASLMEILSHLRSLASDASLFRRVSEQIDGPSYRGIPVELLQKLVEYIERFQEDNSDKTLGIDASTLISRLKTVGSSRERAVIDVLELFMSVSSTKTKGLSRLREFFTHASFMDLDEVATDDRLTEQLESRISHVRKRDRFHWSDRHDAQNASTVIAYRQRINAEAASAPAELETPYVELLTASPALYCLPMLPQWRNSSSVAEYLGTRTLKLPIVASPWDSLVLAIAMSKTKSDVANLVRCDRAVDDLQALDRLLRHFQTSYALRSRSPYRALPEKRMKALVDAERVSEFLLAAQAESLANEFTDFFLNETISEFRSYIESDVANEEYKRRYDMSHNDVPKCVLAEANRMSELSRSLLLSIRSGHDDDRITVGVVQKAGDLKYDETEIELPETDVRRFLLFVQPKSHRIQLGFVDVYTDFACMQWDMGADTLPHLLNEVVNWIDEAQITTTLWIDGVRHLFPGRALGVDAIVTETKTIDSEEVATRVDYDDPSIRISVQLVPFEYEIARRISVWIKQFAAGPMARAFAISSKFPVSGRSVLRVFQEIEGIVAQ